jgi:SAM-dependent methyltransferase
MKLVMGGQNIPIRMKISQALAIYCAHRNKIFSNAENVIAFHKTLLLFLDKYVGIPVQKARVLEIGCGQTAPQVALFHADGANAIGIDIEVPTYRMNLSIFLQVIRLNGIERALKSLARHILFDKNFLMEISKLYGKPVTFDNIDTRIMDASHMTFDSASFDFIFSVATFEHINDVTGAVKEINRVLTHSGIAFISTAPLPSLAGGHSLEWQYPDQSPSTMVPPWDHLCDNKYPANVYLNKLTVNQYRDIFRSHTNVVEERTTIEGVNLLTKEIEEELKIKGYTKEDLLTRNINFFVRKKAPLSR